jgi:urease accessory protein
MLSTLRALWQADGAFPSGAFAFSYGMEGVLALRQGIDTDEFASLLSAVLRHRWATYDRVALLRSFRADGDLAAIASVDREVEASTLVQPLRDGSRRNGASFLASHARLGTTLAGELRDAVRAGELLGHIPVMQGAVWSAIGLDEGLAQLTSGYSAASGLVTAAVRLGAIGALEAQRVLGDCLPLIEQLAAEEVQDDAQMQSFLPFIEIASARHAQADLRLFAN